VENEGINVLKQRGYHFEHNYGHGDQHLSTVLLSYPSRRGRMRPRKKLTWDGYNRHWSPDKLRPCPPWSDIARC
jgi:hypothetical protein